MIIPVITDIHIGVRNASQIFAEYQLKFFEDEFFPYLKANNITDVICCGDLFDTRKFSNHIILDMWNKRFFDYLKDNNITFHLILGNHDLALRNSLKVNAPKLFLSHYSNVIIYDKPTEVNFDGTDILLVPWICTENYSEVMSAIQDTAAQIMFGHLELANFEMHKGQIVHEGMDASIFSKFEAVYSGHFHHRSTRGNVNYLGCTMEFTWIDYNDPKGYHAFDTKTREMTFKPNPFTMFNKIEYDDKNKSEDYWKSIHISSYTQSYTKIIVVNKTDPYQFDRFLDKCYNNNFADLKIVEDFSDIDSDSVDDDDLEMEDTMTLAESYIDSIDVVGEKDKLKNLMRNLYTSALEIVD